LLFLNLLSLFSIFFLNSLLSIFTNSMITSR
jgi:hypothetical protein